MACNRFCWATKITIHGWGIHLSSNQECCQLLTYNWGFLKELLLTKGDASSKVTSSLRVSPYLVAGECHGIKAQLPCLNLDNPKGLLQLQSSLCYWLKPVLQLCCKLLSLSTLLSLLFYRCSQDTGPEISGRQIFMPESISRN